MFVQGPGGSVYIIDWNNLNSFGRVIDFYDKLNYKKSKKNCFLLVCTCIDCFMLFYPFSYRVNGV